MNKTVAIENFESLDDIFADPVFQEMFDSLKPQKVERLDPEVEKFKELLDWVCEAGREPQPSGSMTEKLKHRYLKGLRADESRRLRCLPYDDLGLLGGSDDGLG